MMFRNYKRLLIVVAKNPGNVITFSGSLSQGNGNQTENIVRNKIGFERRDTYGGKPINWKN